MGANWMWLVLLAAALAHAVRWIPADAPSRGVKMPAAFAVLYAIYAVVVSLGGPFALLVALIVVEVLLQLYRRRQHGGAARRPR